MGHRASPVVSEAEAARVGWRLYPGAPVGGRHPQPGAVAQRTSHWGDGLSASVAIVVSRGLTRPLQGRSTFPAFPRPPPPRGWSRSDHWPQSFVPQITPQHVWVGPPGQRGARLGALPPFFSILLHRPCAVLQEYACSLPGRSWHKRRGLSPLMCAMLTPDNTTMACATVQGVLCHRCVLVSLPAS